MTIVRPKNFLENTSKIIIIIIISPLVADLYIDLYDAIMSNQPVGHGREGYYFGENGENHMYDISMAVSKALVNLGKLKSPELTSFTKEEIDSYLWVSTFASLEIQADIIISIGL